MFKVLQLSDCHLFGERDTLGLKDMNPYLSLQAVCAFCADWSPDMVLVTGDISGDDSAQSYQDFKTLVREYFDCSILTLAGNHDNNAQYDPQLKAWDLPQNGPVRCGNWLLHGLDTRHRGTLGRVNKAQWQSVTSAVNDAPELHHVLALHHHPKPTRGWMDKHALVNADELCAQVSALPALKVVIYGHVHTAGSVEVKNTEYLSAPSTCWQFAGTADFALDSEAPGARRLTLRDDGRLDTDIVRLPDGV